MKRFLIKSRVAFLVGLLGAGIFAPNAAHAIFGIGDVGLFDIPMMQLDALDFIDNVVMRILIVGLLLFVESQILVLIAGKLLDWAVGLQVPLDTSLVSSGWTFMVGILNLVILIIFVIVAFSAILRLETFQMKKVLPRLIAVALLVNFSLLFVGIFVDIAQVFINTIKNALGSFVDLSLAPLKAAWAGPVAAAITALGLKLGLALVPIGNVASAVATGALFFADLALGKGWLLQGIVLTVFNFATGVVFLLFTALFLARTVVIAMLAMLAPLAFAAAVLPGTQKYWNQWLSAVMSWSLLGVVSLFLMGLGMKLFSITVSPLGGNIKGLDAGFLSNIYLYTFLIVYLIAAFIISKRFTPIGAEAILTQAKTLAGKVGNVGGKLFREGLQRDLETKRGNDMLSRSEKLGANLRAWGEKPNQIWGARHLARWAGGSVEVGSRKAISQLHTATEQTLSKAEKAGLNRDPNDNINDIRTALQGKNWGEAAGLMVGTINNGDTDVLREAVKSGKLKWEDVNAAFQHAERHGNPTYLRPILKGFLDKVQDGTLQPNASNRANIWEKLKQEDITSEKVDIASIANTKGGEQVLEQMFLKSDPHVMSGLMRHPKKAVREWAAKYAESKGVDWFIQNQREDIVQTFISSGGRSLGIPLFGGLTQDQLRDRVARRQQPPPAGSTSSPPTSDGPTPPGWTTRSSGIVTPPQRRPRGGTSPGGQTPATGSPTTPPSRGTPPAQPSSGGPTGTSTPPTVPPTSGGPT